LSIVPQNATDNIAFALCALGSLFGTTSLEKDLTLFREYRDQKLMVSPAGRRIVNFYYIYGEYVARFIEGHPVMAFFMRLPFYPLVGFIKLMRMLY